MTTPSETTRTGTPRRRGRVAASWVLAPLTLLAGGVAAHQAFGAVNPPSAEAPEVTTLVSKLRVPWAITFLPDGAALATERSTKRIVKVGPEKTGSELTVTPVQTIDEVNATGESGLLGIAASPQYATDKTVFIYYTAASDNRIAKLKLGEKPQPIVTGIPKNSFHDGGRLGFGPDGYLYASTGDGGVKPNAQDLKSLGGKILRMTLDGKPAPGNPFDGSLVWTYGHRNVQGFAWDASKRMYASEFGDNKWDEVNRIEPGKNYGWPNVEGKGDDPKYTNPLVVWPTSESSCSGAVITGKTLLIACLRGQRVWSLTIGDNGEIAGAPKALFQGQYGRLRAAVNAPDGSVWISTSNQDGRGQPAATDDRILRVTL